VSACNSEISGRADAAGGPAPTGSAPRTAAATPSAAAPTAEPGLDEAADGLRPFLLGAADIGAGFVPGAEPQPDPTAPTICGGEGVVARFPYAVRVGARFDGPTPGVFVEERVSVYGDVATAEAAYQANVDGLDCSDGTAPDSVVITPPEDLGVDVPADQSTGWRIGDGTSDLVLIAVRSDELVVNFLFVGPAGQTAGLPDPLVIARAGVEKLSG
jgi:hypothetical protein